MRVSISLTRRTVKPLLTRLRRFLWSGSSRLIMSAIAGASGRMPWALQKVAGSFDTAMTSS
jgi:hypothetical protein